MRLFDVAEIDAALSYPGLIDILDDAFRSEVIAPKRGQYAIQRPDETDAILLTMPAWSGPDVANPYIGTKIVSVFFGNGKRNLPGVMGAYLLMDGATGKPLAVMDGNRLTTWRTAAASALASRYMSNPESSRMLMVGAGALAPFIIKAHRSVRPLTEIAVWARRPEAAEATVAELAKDGIEARATTDLEGEARTADIISCATNATEPLIHGHWLKREAHLDLIGGFTMQMREADADALHRARVIVDSSKAIDEGGDVAVAIAEGSYSADRIAGTLADLCHGRIAGPVEGGGITLFKSVGVALEDLAAAVAVWERRA
ncbi:MULTISPECIES: ornithine cyclodeaminase family protein [Bosea]|jgi:ornithine cyclodeaminase/alanine dehydrogenase-like protein (mu-crystallin family)|uniref:ornithine cyclodeaminase family protein n=1 Tax=Bosea TaxID=85413 RepID=UPI00214FDFFA|nr:MULTISPECIES: ornithine cyclodeaminase family protein [Bosea]MCR4524281.1 ornithine cyclodeaminase family protein [Bosea sp. 47.2.35]MDR6826369.1 ornithine cyclodeaminase [Bosea robiniae]MDR6893079.1 ornithine cyclodeaminase [Bosea sp. BE109]MDR7137223.1 ornithine cyclodeaminase [Bosea sp. BE168]MDR7173923.1 ornithine cyclodeaminase [Bosea sp. BE271]